MKIWLLMFVTSLTVLNFAQAEECNDEQIKQAYKKLEEINQRADRFFELYKKTCEINLSGLKCSDLEYLAYDIKRLPGIKFSIGYDAIGPYHDLKLGGKICSGVVAQNAEETSRQIKKLQTDLKNEYPMADCSKEISKARKEVCN